MSQQRNKNSQFDKFENKFKIVVIQNPYLVWENKKLSYLFHKMVLLKKKGYEACYSQPVLPVDTTDFIATHILLCTQYPNGNLNPVMGYKVVTLQTCDNHNLVFPALALTQQAKAPTHSLVVNEILNLSRRYSTSLAYLGSWTVDHDFKIKNNFQQELREIFMTSYLSYFHEQQVSEVLIGGTLRFGTEKLFSKLDFVPLAFNQQELPPIGVAHLAHEPVLVMHAKHIPEVSNLKINSWQSLWEDRLVIGASKKSDFRKAA